MADRDRQSQRQRDRNRDKERDKPKQRERNGQTAGKQTERESNSNDILSFHVSPAFGERRSDPHTKRFQRTLIYFNTDTHLSGMRNTTIPWSLPKI